MRSKSCLFVVLILVAQLVIAQDIKYISLKDKEISFTPRHFHIIVVKDDRADTANIGTISSDSPGEKQVLMYLHDGLTMAITSYLGKNLRQDTSAIAVELHVSQIEVSENKEGTKTELKLKTGFAFSIAGKTIAEYNGSGSQQTRWTDGRHIEELIRSNLEDALQQFDDWFAKNKDEVMALFKPPLVNVIIKKASNDTDKIAWSLQRPLMKEDFKGKPEELSKASAATYVEISLNYSMENKNGRILFTVTLIPFFDKTRSWRHKRKFDERVLQHERMHFNIAAIVACELAASISTHSFTKDKFESEIQELYREKGKLMQQLNMDYEGDKAWFKNS